MRLDLLVEMQGSAHYSKLQLNASKKPLGTILGTL